MDRIPFLDLITPHLDLEEELVEVFRKSVRTAGFIGGPMVAGFEKDFGDFCESPYCVGVNSGTDALRFALIAAGVGQGDVVLTVPNTFIATTEAISQAGASPRFIDIDERTYNMDPGKLEEYLIESCSHASDLAPRPKAIIPVHLYGQMADMDPIMEIAEEYGLIVIEDACQAHGAEYFSKKDGRWKKAGSVGRAAAFSFYPGKNLGACGEGGAVTTNDEELALKVKALRDHGQSRKYHHEMEGYNGRLDAIQAGILQLKLKHLPEWTEKRRWAAARYNELLRGIDGLVPPHEENWSKAVYHLYIVRSGVRDELQKYLSGNNIDTGLHYPIPLHLQNAYVGKGYKKGDFPVSERMAEEILSLPMYPGLTEEQIGRVVDNLRNFCCVTK